MHPFSREFSKPKWVGVDQLRDPHVGYPTRISRTPGITGVGTNGGYREHPGAEVLLRGWGLEHPRMVEQDGMGSSIRASFQQEHRGVSGKQLPH